MTYDDLNIFSDIEESLVGNTQTLFDKSADLIVSISPIFSLAFGVYILLQVFHYYNKGFDEPLMDISKRLIGWIIIIALAFNATSYKNLAQTAYELPNALSEVVSSSEYKATTMDDNFRSMNNKLSKLDELYNKLGTFDYGDKFAWHMLRIILYATLGLVMIVCFAYYLVAKLSLVLVLMFGPIFIGCLLFPTTRQWGMSWINQVMNYSLAMACYVLIGVMQQEFVSNKLIQIIDYMDYSDDVMAYMYMLIVLSLFAMVVFILVSWNIPSVASGIVGGGSFSGGFHTFKQSVPNITLFNKNKKHKEPNRGGSVKPTKEPNMGKNIK